MTKILSIVGGVAAAALMVVGLAGVAVAQPAPAAQPDNTPGYDAPGSQTGAGPTGATRPLETPVLYVTSIEVIRSATEPKIDIVRVSGLASSQGWSAPQLVPFYFGQSADNVLDLQFIATSPQQSQKAEGYVPISAMFTLDASHPFKGVRIRASANAIEVKTLPGTAQASIKANDCKQCIGKKFVEKGQQSTDPAGSIIRGEDLPRGYRTITPGHGVAGIVHNPNRLNLILDEGNKVTMVFWE